MINNVLMIACHNNINKNNWPLYGYVKLQNTFLKNISD